MASAKADSSTSRWLIEKSRLCIPWPTVAQSHAHDTGQRRCQALRCCADRALRTLTTPPTNDAIYATTQGLAPSSVRGVDELQLELAREAHDVAVAKHTALDAVRVHEDAVLAANVLDRRGDAARADLRVQAADEVARDPDVAGLAAADRHLGLREWERHLL